MADELARNAALEVDTMIEDWSEPGEPFDYLAYADSIEKSLARDPTGASFDPQDPVYWRAVATELRRRSIRLV